MFANRIILNAGLVFLISIAFGGLLIYFLEAKREFESRAIANSIATSYAQSLEKQLSRSLSSTLALATVVKREFESRAIANSIATSYAQSLEKQLSGSRPSTSAKTKVEVQNNTLAKFDSLAEGLMGRYGGISNLQLAPKGIVKQIFPLEGYQENLGQDLNKNPYAMLAVQSKELTLEGPIQLAQGGDAVLGRYPVYLSNLETGEEEFWGFSIALIEWSTLLETAGIYELISNNYLFELSRVDAFTGQNVVFSKSDDSVLEDPLSVDIEIPQGKWILSVVPKEGWHSISYALLEGVLVLMFSGLLSFLSYRHFLKGNELQNQKNEYEIIFNSAPAFIVYKDRQNNILRVNKAVADSLNLKMEEIEGKQFKKLYPDNYEKYYSDDLEVINSGKPKLGVVENYQLESGEVKWVQTDKVPYRDKDGTILGTLLFAIDITKQKEAENQALEYLKKLKKINKELEEFSVVASHDLQEPLRKIIVFGDRLATNISKKSLKSKDYLERMQSAAARMQLLIDDLLIYAQLKTKPEPLKVVNLKEIIQGVLVDLETRIHKSNGIVNVGDLPTLEADPVQMHQLFLNLIGNALKFHRAGVAPVVDVNASPEENGFYKITVKDNGIGIDEAHFKKIFKPLERLHRQSEYEGTGMGLSICDKIVSRHGGEITVKNNKAGGVIFSIRLREHQTISESE